MSSGQGGGKSIGKSFTQDTKSLSLRLTQMCAKKKTNNYLNTPLSQSTKNLRRSPKAKLRADIYISLVSSDSERTRPPAKGKKEVKFFLAFLL